MTEQATALSLMRMAMVLLDRNGMTIAACHLEQAIHVASHPADTGAVLDHDALASEIRAGLAKQQSGASPERRV